MSRKVTKEEWEFEVNRAMKVRKVQAAKMKQAKYAYFNNIIKKIMPFPYIIGGAAVITLYVLYGWKEFLKFFLSWVVSMTLIATAAYYIWKHYEEEL
jgi:hypothetical protein